MSDVTLHIPLRLTWAKGFFNPDGIPGVAPAKFLGFPARLKLDQRPYVYLVLDNVPLGEAETVLQTARRSIVWAAVRLDIGILTDREPLKRTELARFDGQFATAIPTGVHPDPMRIAGNHRNEEPSTRLFAALAEGVDQTDLIKPKAKASLLLACELFASVDFEATPNAQFLMLTAVYEVLSSPKRRPKPCVDLVKELLDRAKQAKEAAAAAGDGEMAEAFKALMNSAGNLKKEGITSSVRRLATCTSQALGDAHPENAGKRASDLYGKRSGLVHRGESVTLADVGELRRLVREALAVEAGCFEHIRERYP